MKIRSFCGENNSVDRTFILGSFTKSFKQKVTRRFNMTYNSQISPIIEEILFGIISNSNEKSTINKFNYIMLFMRYFIYSRKLNDTEPVDLVENNVNK